MPGPEKRHCPQLHSSSINSKADNKVTVSISKPTQR
jgi:hypothetical protein